MILDAIGGNPMGLSSDNIVIYIITAIVIVGVAIVLLKLINKKKEKSGKNEKNN